MTGQVQSVVVNKAPKRVTFDIQFLRLHDCSSICGWQFILGALSSRRQIWTNAKNDYCGLPEAKLYFFKVRKYLRLTRPCGLQTGMQIDISYSISVDGGGLILHIYIHLRLKLHRTAKICGWHYLIVRIWGWQEIFHKILEKCQKFLCKMVQLINWTY